MAIDNSNLYKSLGLKTQSANASANTKSAAKKGTGELALKDFLNLMTTQMKHQDPMKPMESGDFLNQIASFATVTGIEDLQKSFGSFAASMKSDQALRGSALVGRSVLVPSAVGQHSAEKALSGVINVKPSVTNLKIQIYNEKNELITTINKGAASGNVKFTWDGLDKNGKKAAFGNYKFIAIGSVKGKTTSFPTAVVAKVDSVLVNQKQGLIMNLAGIGAMPFKKAQEIL